MTSKANRFFLMVTAFICVFISAVSIKMLFSEGHNIILYFVVMQMMFNCLLLTSIARFFWFQDELLKVMTAFYPVVERLEQVGKIIK
jgi:hypothetical protein